LYHIYISIHKSDIHPGVEYISCLGPGRYPPITGPPIRYPSGGRTSRCDPGTGDSFRQVKQVYLYQGTSGTGCRIQTGYIKTHRIHFATFGYIRIHLGTLGYIRIRIIWVHQDTLGYIRIHLGTLGYIWVHQYTVTGTSGYSWVHKDTLGYIKKHLGEPGETLG